MKIGIMPEPLVRARLLAIARGDYVAGPEEPKVWYSSVNAIAQILSPENIALLRLIDEQKPESLTTLAKLAGRNKSNLSITLKSLSAKGFVKLEKMPRNLVKPVALHTDFEIISNAKAEAVFKTFVTNQDAA